MLMCVISIETIDKNISQQCISYCYEQFDYLPDK